MYFLQATQAPVLVTLPDKRVISVPKMTIREIQEWANEICEQRHEDQTEGLDGDRKREYTRFYPKLPPTIPELRGLIRTVPGIEAVIRKTFVHATNKGTKTIALNNAEINNLIAGSTHQFEDLVQDLADLDDQSKKNKKGQIVKDEAGNEDGEEDHSDPTK